jgi:hypothetical protein
MAQSIIAGQLRQTIGENVYVLHTETEAGVVLTTDGSNAQTEINTLKAALGAQARVYVRNDIAGRDDLEGMSVGDRVYVIDATSDTTVASGGAEYMYTGDTPAWIKISEAETMDVIPSWADITGKPTSTASAIDSAVTASHSHSNKATLDKFGDSNGLPTYNGNQIGGLNIVDAIPGDAPDGLYFVTTEEV